MSRMSVSEALSAAKPDTVIDTLPQSALTPWIDANALSPSPLMGVYLATPLRLLLVWTSPLNPATASMARTLMVKPLVPSAQ